MNGLIEGMRRHSREQAAHAAQRARDWTARLPASRSLRNLAAWPAGVPPVGLARPG